MHVIKLYSVKLYEESRWTLTFRVALARQPLAMNPAAPPQPPAQNIIAVVYHGLAQQNPARLARHVVYHVQGPLNPVQLNQVVYHGQHVEPVLEGVQLNHIYCNSRYIALRNKYLDSADTHSMVLMENKVICYVDLMW